jgi:hypothetical protein
LRLSAVALVTPVVTEFLREYVRQGVALGAQAEDLAT